MSQQDQSAQRAVEAVIAGVSDVLAPTLDMEGYLPIILNPHRCLNADIQRILDFNGIQARQGSIGYDKLRRLAVIGPDMRAWRGAFRSHRSIAAALTGGPVLMIPWVAVREILDVSSMAWMLMDDTTDTGTTVMYVLGQGPDATDYSENELMARLDELAKPVLDTIIPVPSYAVTAWRNGVGAWKHDGRVRMVSSDVEFEFEGLEIGPDVFPGDCSVRSPTRAPAAANSQSDWMTSWFWTDGADDGSQWEMLSYASVDAFTGASGSAYVIRLPVGAGDAEFYRLSGGVYGSVLGSWAVDLEDGLTGPAHRVDFTVTRTPTYTRLRAYIDGNPGPTFDDTVVAGRPSGNRVFVGERDSQFPSGVVRVAGITSRRD